MANGVFDFVMPTFDYTLTAKWECASSKYELDNISGKYLCKECGGDHLVKVIGDFIVLTADNANTLIKYNGNGKEVVIPNNITKIGENAFKNRYNLTSITLPGSVLEIGKSAFENCNNLTNVYITDIAKWCEISFVNELSNPLYYAKNFYLNEKIITDLNIPNGTTAIGDYSFYAYKNLANVTIPNSITSIGKFAFAGCVKLTNVTLPNSVTSIGDSIFAGCSSLESLTIPFVGSSINSDEKGFNFDPFGYLFGTTSYEGGVATKQYYAHNNYWDDIYYIPSTLKSVTVLGGEIVRGSFENCKNITTVILGSDVKRIGMEAFRNCTNLTSITISSSVTSIDPNAFDGCTELTSVIFENATGWRCSSDYAAEASISAAELSNPATAATYLKSTYSYYYWKRG